jgi:hypothetical protein
MAGLFQPGRRALPYSAQLGGSRSSMITSGNSDVAQIGVCFRYGQFL